MSIFCSNCMKKIDDGLKKCPYCGSSTDISNRPHQLEPMTILNGRYLTGRVLGEGGFGITYIGLDLRLNLTVAIKEYYPAGIINRYSNESPCLIPTTAENARALNEGKKQFFNEAVILGRYKEDEHIINVVDFFSENETAYIVMEYIDGYSLQAYLNNNGPVLNFSELYAMMKPVLLSLEKVHASGVIHRDISPSNIMIKKDGTIKLLDFGEARNIGTAGGNDMSVVLKHGFAPIEQYAKHGAQGTWTDVYAVCATMYKLLTGSTLEASPDRLNLDSGLGNLKKLGVKISKAQQKVLEKGLAVKPENRIQTVSELIHELDAASSKGNSSSSKLKVIIPVFGALAAACIIAFNASGRQMDDDVIQSPEISSEEITDVITANRTESPFNGVRGNRDTLITYGESIYAIRKDGVIVSNDDLSDFAFIPDTYDWKDITDVISGDEFVAGLKKDGTVVIDSSSYEFDSVSEWTNIIKIIPAFYDYYIVGLKDDGTVVHAGGDYYNVSDCDDWTDIADITACGYRLAGIKKDGSVVNTKSEYPDMSGIKNAVKISYCNYGGVNVCVTSDGKAEIFFNYTSFEATKFSSLTDIADAEAGYRYIVFTKKDGSVCVYDYCDDKLIYPEWTDVKQVFAGNNAYGAVFNDGSIAFVDNDEKYGIEKPEEIKDVDSVISLTDYGSTGWTLLFLMKDGTVKSYGEDLNGNTNVDNWNNISGLFCGLYSLGLKTDGTVVVTEPYTENAFGSPDEWTDVEALYCDYGYLMALKSDGTVVMSGNDRNGLCSVKDWTDIAAIEVSPNFSIGLKKDGTVICNGNDYMLEGIINLNNIADIESCWFAAAALLDNGRVVVTDYSSYTSSTDSKIYKANQWSKIQKIDMSEDGDIIAGICEDGTVRCTGSHEFGSDWTDIVDISVGGSCYERTNDDGTTENVDTMILVGLKSDGTVVAEGYNDYGQIDAAKQWENIADIVAGDGTIIGLTNDGDILIAGNAEFYENTDSINNIRLPNE